MPVIFLSKYAHKQPQILILIFFSPLIENQICLFCYIIPYSSHLYHAWFFCISSNLCKYMKVNMKKPNNKRSKYFVIVLSYTNEFA